MIPRRSEPPPDVGQTPASSPEVVDRFAPSEEPHRIVRFEDATLGWKDWLWTRYARYWYGVGSIALDIVLVGAILRGEAAPTPAWRYAAAILALLGLSVVEVLVYRHLWHRGPEDPTR